jgi:single-strand DNA-binding protein
MNRVTLIGRLGKDPQVKTFDNGNKVASFSLATSEKYKDKDGNRQEKTEWHNCQVWGSLAGVVESYVKKGDLLALEGKISTRSYTQDNVTKYVTEIVCEKLEMLGGGNGKNTTTENPNEPVNAPIANEPVNANDDDLPF